MSMSIRNNVASLDAQRNLQNTGNALNTSLQRLSSGYRLNSAQDDAAGFGIDMNLQAQIRSYNQASRNANDGISFIQTAQGSLNQVSNILTRMRELAMEASSDGVGASQRTYIQGEANQLSLELDRLQNTGKYNGVTMFGGSSPLQFQVDINGTSNDSIQVDTTSMSISSGALSVSANAVGTGGNIDLTTSTSTAQAALATIDTALGNIAKYQASLGATANRFANVVTNIQSFVVNLTAADSRIKDVDVAEETSNMTRLQILQQAGVSVLSQANQQAQLALKLIGG
jgi:flagellin